MQRPNVVCGIVGAAMLLGLAGHNTSLHAQQPDNKVHQSSGVRATIVSNNYNEKGQITINFAIHNDTGSKIYLFWVGGFRGAMTNGDFYHVTDVVGIPFCKDYTDNDAVNLERCLNKEARDINYYSPVDSLGETYMAIRFEPIERDVRLKPNSILSFSVKFVSRSEAIRPTGGRAELSEPRVITINFPLIPINTTQ